MTEVQEWLDATRAKWHCDFLGIAIAGDSEDGGREIRWHFVSGNQSQAYQNIRLKKGRGIAGMVWKTGRIQQDEDILRQPAKFLEYPIARTERLAAMLAVPLVEKEQVCGVFAVGYRSEHNFQPFESERMTDAAPHLVSLLEGAGKLG